MLGDVGACCDPCGFARCDMLENAIECAYSARPSDHAEMKAYRHHLGCVLSFPDQPIVGVNDVIGKVRPTESSCVLEMHIVGIECIGNNEVPASGDPHVIWQVVIVGIAVVKKAAL